MYLNFYQIFIYILDQILICFPNMIMIISLKVINNIFIFSFYLLITTNIILHISTYSFILYNSIKYNKNLVFLF